MKRTLLTVCALAAFAAASWAQVTFPTATVVSSLQSSKTAGVMLNEIDQSFTANGDFGKVVNPFLLAGVMGNPDRLYNVDSDSVFDIGYYQNGKLPFSLYGSFSGSGITASSNTASQWANRSYAGPAFSDFNGVVQGLVQVSGITGGLALVYSPSNASTNAAYYTDTTVNTTTSGASTVANSTTTITANNMTSELASTGTNTSYSTTSFTVPVYLKTGNLEHNAFLRLSLLGKDKSGSYTETTTAPTVTAGTTSDDYDIKVTDSTNQTGFELNYALTLPGFIGSANGNKFSAGIDVTDAILTSTYSYTGIDTIYNVSTLGSKTESGKITVTGSTSYNTLNYLKLTAMAKHSFNFAPAQGMSFGLLPQVVVSYDNNPNSAFSTYASGLGSATENSSTSTTAVSGTTSAVAGSTTTQYTGTRTNLSNVGAAVYLPTAYKIKPDAWPFGLYGGATPYASFTWKTTEVVHYTDSVQDNQASSTVLSPSFGESHVFGIFVPFAGDIRADIALSGGTSSSGLLDFNSLTLQIYVPLK